MTITARQLPEKAADGVGLVSVSFAPVLDTDELLIGTPTVEEVTTSDLTIDNVAVSTDFLDINGEAVPVGKAVRFRVSGGTAGTRYTLKVTPDTNSAPAQTIPVLLMLRVT
ncbi:MAG: hypothetical protein GY788_07540 [bacterium]|nr:hypothetical protein [bacterium]